MSTAPSLHENSIHLLGQGGSILKVDGLNIYVDPYLSNSVQELDDPELERLVDIPINPEDVTDADWVLITHNHIDHCDPQTIPVIAKYSPNAKFMAPKIVLDILIKWDIEQDRLHLAKEEWLEITPSLKIHTVPAAHRGIDYDSQGNLLYVGYVVDVSGKRIYLAGDTRVADDLLEALIQLSPITIGILPVNEHNYFRARQGIIGNMSPREAFIFADELGFDRVIPVHWDMFEVNSASPVEIQAVYDHIAPKFKLELGSKEIRI